MYKSLSLSTFLTLVVISCGTSERGSNVDAGARDAGTVPVANAGKAPKKQKTQKEIMEAAQSAIFNHFVQAVGKGNMTPAEAAEALKSMKDNQDRVGQIATALSSDNAAKKATMDSLHAGYNTACTAVIDLLTDLGAADKNGKVGRKALEAAIANFTAASDALIEEAASNNIESAVKLKAEKATAIAEGQKSLRESHRDAVEKALGKKGFKILGFGSNHQKALVNFFTLVSESGELYKDDSKTKATAMLTGIENAKSKVATDDHDDVIGFEEDTSLEALKTSFAEICELESMGETAKAAIAAATAEEFRIATLQNIEEALKAEFETANANIDANKTSKTGERALSALKKAKKSLSGHDDETLVDFASLKEIQTAVASLWSDSEGNKVSSIETTDVITAFKLVSEKLGIKVAMTVDAADATAKLEKKPESLDAALAGVARTYLGVKAMFAAEAMKQAEIDQLNEIDGDETLDADYSADDKKETASELETRRSALKSPIQALAQAIVIANDNVDENSDAETVEALAGLAKAANKLTPSSMLQGLGKALKKNTLGNHLKRLTKLNERGTDLRDGAKALLNLAANKNVYEEVKANK